MIYVFDDPSGELLAKSDLEPWLDKALLSRRGGGEGMMRRRRTTRRSACLPAPRSSGWRPPRAVSRPLEAYPGSPERAPAGRGRPADDDSTLVRAHQQAADAKGDSATGSWPFMGWLHDQDPPQRQQRRPEAAHFGLGQASSVIACPAFSVRPVTGIAPARGAGAAIVGAIRLLERKESYKQLPTGLIGLQGQQQQGWRCHRQSSY